jgi:hypothetical protein
MSKLFAIICALMFALLAAYSYQHKAQAYAGRAEFNALLDKSMGDAAHRKAAGRLDRLKTSPAKHGKAAVMADLWQLSENDIAKPVDLFGEGVQ